MKEALIEKTEFTGTVESETMKAAVLTAPGTFEILNAPKPEPEEGQVLVAIEGCGICASSLPLWEGREWFNYPIDPGAPGHEAWGTVESVGENVKGFARGERVAFLSYGSYAEYDVVDSRFLLKLPPVMADMPFPGEPLACSMNIFNRSDIRKGQTVAIIGAGFLGALLTQLAKSAGARVIALSKREYSLQIARENGADETILLDDHYKIIEQVKELTNGKFCERVIEATGKEWPLNLAGELTAERGKIIIAGFHQDGMRSVNIQLWNWRGIDVINAHERAPEAYMEGMRQALKAVTEGLISPNELYTHTLDLDKISIGFDLLKNRPDGFVKALIKI